MLGVGDRCRGERFGRGWLREREQPARRAQISRVKRSAAIDAWRSEIEKLYGWLISEVGKKKAERFFPRTTEKKTAKEAPKEGASKGPAPTAEAPSGSTTKAA